MTDVEVEVDAALRGARPHGDIEGLRALAGIRSRLFGRAPAELVVGRYRLRERLGEGGLGVVYAAHDPELDREVAIKLVRHASSTDATVEQERLVREAQALARLSHPNVVEVFDVGTYDGLPGALDDEDGAPRSCGVFIAMARLEGQTLKEWLEAEPRRWPAVLERFSDAGQGLLAAHQAGLVHRDFKPANVFIERSGRVRVLDFGLARGHGPRSGSATASRGLEDPRSTLTHTGLVLGTPAYMAPEQHQGGVVDARSDQYCFCAALYHGLYGVLPFRGTDLDAIAEDKHRLALTIPTRSTRVPRWLRATLLRGLSPDPARRWPSMASLLAALDTRSRQARHRRLAVGAAALGLCLVAWLTLDTSPTRCDDEHDLVAAAWNDSSRSAIEQALAAHDAGRHALPHVIDRLDAHTRAWHAERRALCEVMQADSAPADVDLRMECLRRTAEHLGVLTRVFADADADTAARASTAVAQLPAVERCRDVELLRAELGPSMAPADEPAADSLRTGITEVYALVTAGKLDDALTAAQARVEQAHALGHPPLLAEALWWEGHVRRVSGQLEPALPVLEEAAHLAAAHGHDKIAALAAVELTTSLAGLARFDEALEWARHAEAAALRYGEDRYPLARARAAEGTVLRLLGREEQAYQRYREALAVQQRADPNGHDLPTLLNNLGTAALGLGRDAEAQGHYTRSHEQLAALLGHDHPQTAEARMNLGIVTAELGQHQAAQAHYAAARDVFVRLFGAQDERVAYCDTNLGNLLLELDRPEEARDSFAAARDVFAAKLGPGHPNTATARAGVGLALLRLDRPPREAREAFERALADMREALGPEHPHVGVTMGQVGQALLAEGEPAAARTQLEAAVALLERASAEPGLLHEARFHRARARWDTGDHAGAWAQVREAREWFEAHGPSSLRAAIETWSTSHPQPPATASP